MLYVSEFFHCFAGQAMKGGAQKSTQKPADAKCMCRSPLCMTLHTGELVRTVDAGFNVQAVVSYGDKVFVGGKCVQRGEQI